MTRNGARPLAQATWGEANRSHIGHVLSRAVPALSRLLDMPSVAQSGDRNMPHVAAPSFGQSERLVVAPGHEERATLSMPGGQSGHPMSPYYGAGHADWVAGRRHAVAGRRGAARAHLDALTRAQRPRRRPRAQVQVRARRADTCKDSPALRETLPRPSVPQTPADAPSPTPSPLPQAEWATWRRLVQVYLGRDTESAEIRARLVQWVTFVSPWLMGVNIVSARAAGAACCRRRSRPGCAGRGAALICALCAAGPGRLAAPSPQDADARQPERGAQERAARGRAGRAVGRAALGRLRRTARRRRRS